MHLSDDFIYQAYQPLIPNIVSHAGLNQINLSTRYAKRLVNGLHYVKLMTDE